MKLKWLLPRIITILLSTLLTLEIGVRIAAQYTEDGQLMIQGRIIPPLRVPVERHRMMTQRYEEQATSAFVGYDAQTGWSFIPGRVSSDNLYHINQAGFRDEVDYEYAPAADILRIALFGDSFVQGDEVPFENTFGYYLEADLYAQGIRAEVLNFGVGGYGMDQAYLRWQSLGQQFQPDIVLFGFMPENMNRNVNIIRLIYFPATEGHFSKPRFVLDGDNLRLVNSPAITPEAVTTVLEQIDTHPLMQYEYYYDGRYNFGFGSLSAAYAWVKYLLNGSIVQYESIPPNDERHLVTVGIIEAFDRDVEAAASQFIVVHFPHNPTLQHYFETGTIPHQYVLDEIAVFAPVIQSENAFENNDARYWMPRFHYSPVGNQVMATYSANALVGCLDDESCLSARFQTDQRFRTGN